MRRQPRHLFANAALVAMVTLTAACLSSGGSQPPVVVPPGVPAPLVTVTVQLRDFVTPATVIVGADVSCPPYAGVTDGNGVVQFDVPAGVPLACAFARQGYATNTATFLPSLTDTLLGASMTAEAPSVPVSRNARQGRLRLEARGFFDASGQVNPLYAHAGDLFSLFTRDRARALEQLDAVALAGYQGVRVWSTLGGSPYWAGREVGVAVTSEYWEQVRQFAVALRERGLRAVWSQGDVGQITDRRAYMSTLARVDNEVGGFIDIVDCGNEAWQTGEPDPARLAQCVGYYQDAGGAAIRTLTSPPSEEKHDLDAFSIDPAQLFDVHSYRGGRWFDKRRHIFSIPYEGQPRRAYGIGSEPPGGGDLVSVTDNKHEMDNESVPLLAVTSIVARQAFVWFAGEGVKIQRGLQTEPGFWTTPTAVEWLPRDVMTFETLHHSGDRWRGTRIVASTREGRVDCRTSADGRFACTLDGPSGGYSFAVERGFTGRLCNPTDGICADVSKRAGESLDVTFTRGRVLVGRVQ